LLSETVNPANGSVNIGIQFPVPQSRGITLPVPLSYNSNSVNHISPLTPSLPIWVSGFDDDPWSTAPLLSWAGSQTQMPNGTNYTPQDFCFSTQDFVFNDPSGISISFNVFAGSIESTVTHTACPGAGNGETSTIDGYTMTLIPNCSPAPSCPITGVYPLTATVTDPHGNVYSFGNVPMASMNLGEAPASIEDRNGNEVTLTGLSVVDTAGRTVYSRPAPPQNPTYPYTINVTLSGQTYQVTYTTSLPNFTVPSNQVDAPASPITCTWPTTVHALAQSEVQSITLPNSQSYHFYYGSDNPNPSFDNPYGLISEIDYPTGIWVRYTWKLADQMSDFTTFDGWDANLGASGDEPGVCHYQYKVPVVATRTVGFGGSSQPILTQSFTYATAWSSGLGTFGPGSTWSTKSTTMVTTDNVRAQTFTTVYNYQPFSVGTPYEGPIPNYG
jgi:hypothetical protein